ncbi:transposase [Geminisphaera colitermitum]|uniref:transposase n=1 Tax=Geminisphaera colitermitum TaxID=1148786 RepID=UPI000158E1D5|nr:transposase [Geminisphaera colitermitum]
MEQTWFEPFNPRDYILYREHRLPHWEQRGDGICYFVTWRLDDALPAGRLRVWMAEREEWMSAHPEPWDASTLNDYNERFPERLEQWLDAGAGECVLRNPAMAGIVRDALLHFDGQRYRLRTFVVMPNHVHVLFNLRHATEDTALSRLLKSWKGYTATMANRALGRSGPLWQEDYWDRIVRSESHLSHCEAYIRDNPRKAGLSPGEFIFYDGGRVSLDEPTTKPCA